MSTCEEAGAGESSSRGCREEGGWHGSTGLTLPAMGLRQAAQVPVGTAVMPSSCRSRVRLPSMVSSEGSGSAGTLASCPAAASCWEGGR